MHSIILICTLWFLGGCLLVWVICRTILKGKGRSCDCAQGRFPCDCEENPDD